MLLYATGCETETGAGEEGNNTTGLSQEQVDGDNVRGGLHPFELIENPEFVPVSDMGNLKDSDMVFLSRALGYVQVFPHKNMGVEVVNDEGNNVWMAVTYCPITRSGISMNRVVENDTMLLTASGYLYKENMMPLDVNTGSIWSQMLLRRFQGRIKQENIFEFREIKTFPLIETTWLTVRTYFPEAMVYITENSQKSLESTSLRQDLGIVSRWGVELFTLDMFPGEITLHTTTVNPGGRTVVLGSTMHHYMLAFLTTYEMEAVQGEFPVLMKDETGTLWNIFGEAVSGERKGERLRSPFYFTAADWAWKDIYEQVDYYKP